MSGWHWQPSEVIFWIPLIMNWHSVQAPWENKTDPSTSHSVKFIQPRYGSMLCKDFFLSSCTGRSWDVDKPALSQRLFPIAPLIRKELSILINANATIKRRNARKQRRKLQESQSSGWRKPHGLLFTVSQAWEAREEWKYKMSLEWWNIS